MTPPDNAPTRLAEKITNLTQQRAAIEAELTQKRRQLRLLSLEVQALQQTDYLNNLHAAQEEKLDLAQQELQALYAHYTE